MLVSPVKNVKGNILTFKMISGEEIICEFISEDTDKFTIINPMMLVMTTIPTQDIDPYTGESRVEKQGMVSFVPWLLSVVEGTHIQVSKSKIVVSIETDVLAANQYKATVSPVTVPPIAPIPPQAPTSQQQNVGIQAAKIGRGRH